MTLTLLLQAHPRFIMSREFARNPKCSKWWRRRELNSTGKKNNFSLSCAVRHKVGVNKGGSACFVFLSLAGHHAPQRMK
jgi:hypothetical protein